jgi:hypothetical protein
MLYDYPAAFPTHERRVSNVHVTCVNMSITHPQRLCCLYLTWKQHVGTRREILYMHKIWRHPQRSTTYGNVYQRARNVF